MDGIQLLCKTEKATCSIDHMYQPYFVEDLPK